MERVLSGLEKDPAPKIVIDYKIIKPEVPVLRPNVNYMTNLS
jgi:hypothetical protein